MAMQIPPQTDFRSTLYDLSRTSYDARTKGGKHKMEQTLHFIADNVKELRAEDPYWLPLLKKIKIAFEVAHMSTSSTSISKESSPQQTLPDFLLLVEVYINFLSQTDFKEISYEEYILLHAIGMQQNNYRQYVRDDFFEDTRCAIPKYLPLIQTIEKITDLTKKKRVSFALAKLIANTKSLSPTHLTTLRITDKQQIFELLKIHSKVRAIRDVELDGYFGVNIPSDTLEEIAKVFPTYICSSMKHLDISPDTSFSLAKICATLCPRELIDNFNHFKLNIPNVFVVAELLARNKDIYVALNIQKLGIKNHIVLTSLAVSCIEANIDAADYLDHFHLEKDGLFEALTAVAKKDIDKTALLFKQYVKNPKDHIDFVKTCCQIHGRKILPYCDIFKVNPAEISMLLDQLPPSPKDALGSKSESHIKKKLSPSRSKGSISTKSDSAIHAKQPAHELPRHSSRSLKELNEIQGHIKDARKKRGHSSHAIQKTAAPTITRLENASIPERGFLHDILKEICIILSKKDTILPSHIYALLSDRVQELRTEDSPLLDYIRNIFQIPEMFEIIDYYMSAIGWLELSYQEFKSLPSAIQNFIFVNKNIVLNTSQCTALINTTNASCSEKSQLSLAKYFMSSMIADGNLKSLGSITPSDSRVKLIAKLQLIKDEEIVLLLKHNAKTYNELSCNPWLFYHYNQKIVDDKTRLEIANLYTTREQVHTWAHEETTLSIAAALIAHKVQALDLFLRPGLQKLQLLALFKIAASKDVSMTAPYFIPWKLSRDELLSMLDTCKTLQPISTAYSLEYFGLQVDQTDKERLALSLPSSANSLKKKELILKYIEIHRSILSGTLGKNEAKTQIDSLFVDISRP